MATTTKTTTWVIAASVVCWLAPSQAAAQSETPSPDAPAEGQSTDRKEEARTRFDRGKSLMRAQALDAALAEFLLSRQLFPTRGNTQNAAVCLSKLNRFDEALEMFENLLREFGTSLTDSDRAVAESEIAVLRLRVGTVEILIVEPGATVMVDGRRRGTTPLSAPLRVSAGSHVVRVYKDGFATFEQRVEVAGRQNTVVEHRLTRLARSGRLSVTTLDGQPAEVLVDNVPVGVTPWEGVIAVGQHAVVLRRQDNSGTQPVSAPVRENEPTTLTLTPELLDSELRVQPSPVNAVVAIDGVAIGRGLWEGRLHSGNHRIEVAAEGFVPAKRPISLRPGTRQLEAIELERDPSSPLWRAKTPPRIVFDLDLAAVVVPLMGGDLNGACGEGCSATPGRGGEVVFHGGYQFSSGIGVMLDLGYTLLAQSIKGRSGELFPKGLAPNEGRMDDDIRLQGLLAGASAFTRVGTSWPVTIRLGAGVLLGSVRDERSGAFITNISPTRYEVGPVTESSRAVYAYAAPEVRVGARLLRRFELSLGLSTRLLFAISRPMWPDETRVQAGDCAAGFPKCEGSARFGTQPLAGTVIAVFEPGIGARLEL